MVRMRWMILGLMGVSALPVSSHAQFIAPMTVDATNSGAMTGTAATDFINLRPLGPGVPLRFGSVVVDSEKLILDGTPLQRGTDYSMDYGTGVVYLMRAQRAGQSLVVNYRYDATKTKLPASPFNGLAGFHFDIAPGSLGMLMGLGMAERTADGQVLTSNVVGMNNSFSFGSGIGLKGLFLVGDKQKVALQSTADMPTQTAAPTVDGGHSELLVQSLETKVNGGKLKFDYQDVGSNFTGFAQALNAGYDQKFVDQLAKEKGLKRMGFALTDAKVGSLALTDGMHTVGDSAGNITWRNFGLKQGGLSLDWQSRDIDKTFTRFNDIAEADRAQLQSEAGILRNTLSGAYAMKFGTLGFINSKIQDDSTGQAIERRVYTLDTSKIKFNLGDQSIDSGFNRFGSLFEADKAQWGKEAGLSRQWMALDASVTKNTSIKFTQNLVRSSTGDTLSRDLNYVGKTWSLQHEVRNIDKGFGVMGNMPGADVDASVKEIAQMYNGTNATFTPDDKNQFINSPGIDRSYTKLQFEPFNKIKLSFDSLSLKGQKDGGQVQNINLVSSNATLNFRKETLGANFTEVTSLMNLERAKLGTLVGINRTDLGFAMNMKDGKKLTFDSMRVDSSTGGAARTAAEFVTKKLDIAVSSRAVDAGFIQANQLVDPEKDVLSSLAGFKESQAKVKWQLLPNMKIDAFFSTAGGSDSINQAKLIRNFAASWSPDKKSGLDYAHLEQDSNNPSATLFSTVFDQLTFTRDLGRIGKLKYVDQRQEYDGLQANLPSFSKRQLSFETKLDKQTTLSTEQTQTRFDNGTKEDISSNTISTALTKTAGVSVTDSSVDRDGTDRDERKRNYGFWYDLGKGMKVNYGYNRQLNGAQAGALQSTLSVTPGAVGDVKLDTASYNVNEWDNTRTQAASNVSVSSAKPLRFGRITDFKFNFGMDTAADYSNWLRENRLVSASGKYASNTIGYIYKSQMDATGARGIDRGITFSTDPSADKKYSLDIAYKLRTLPGDQQFMIRSYNIKARPARNFELTNTLATNPEVAVPNVILGSVCQNARVNRWKLDYKRDPNVTVGGVFDENYANGALSRTGGLTLAFNSAKGSPLTLFLGGETTDQGGARHSLTRYQLRYDPKPGANQQLSIFAGNVTYEHTAADSLNSSGVTLRVDYQFRF